MCRPFCTKDAATAWATKCTWNLCTGCSQCASPTDAPGGGKGGNPEAEPTRTEDLLALLEKSRKAGWTKRTAELESMIEKSRGGMKTAEESLGRRLETATQAGWTKRAAELQGLLHDLRAARGTQQELKRKSAKHAPKEQEEEEEEPTRPPPPDMEPDEDEEE